MSTGMRIVQGVAFWLAAAAYCGAFWYFWYALYSVVARINNG